MFTAKFGPISKLRKALYNLKIHRAKVSNTPWMELPDPIVLNSEYQRYFVFDDETSTWNTSGFDPNIIQGAVTIEEVTFFLNRIISVPVYDEPGCLSCCPGDYYQRLEATHGEL